MDTDKGCQPAQEEVDDTNFSGIKNICNVIDQKCYNVVKPYYESSQEGKQEREEIQSQGRNERFSCELLLLKERADLVNTLHSSLATKYHNFRQVLSAKIVEQVDDFLSRCVSCISNLIEFAKKEILSLLCKFWSAQQHIKSKTRMHVENYLNWATVETNSIDKHIAIHLQSSEMGGMDREAFTVALEVGTRSILEAYVPAENRQTEELDRLKNLARKMSEKEQDASSKLRNIEKSLVCKEKMINDMALRHEREMANSTDRLEQLQISRRELIKARKLQVDNVMRQQSLYQNALKLVVETRYDNDCMRVSLVCISRHLTVSIL